MTEGGKTTWFSRLKDPRVINVLTIGFTLAFGMLYIGQVNAAATKGYAIRELEQQNEDLRHERERLDVEISRLRSLDSVMSREAFLGLRKVDEVKYITVGSGEVALK